MDSREADPDSGEDAEGVRPGTIEVVQRPPGSDDEDGGRTDLFEREEHPIRVLLAVMEAEDAPDLIDALEAEGIGARLGETTTDDGVEVLVHDTNLPDAQAILVEFTGDPTLVDDVELDTELAESDDAGDGWAQVSSGRLMDLGPQATRLSQAGFDVRLEVPDLDAQDRPDEVGALWVDRGHLERARIALGIER
jgi:hypothetical protein